MTSCLRRAGRPRNCSQSSHSRDCVETLGANGVGGVPDVAAQLGVGERGAGGDGKRYVTAEVSDAGGAQEFAHRSAARISARCTVRTPERSRLSSAADVHQARGVPGAAHLGPGLQDVGHLVGQHGGGRIGVLDREGSAEAATGFGLGQLTSVSPRTLRSSRSGLSPTPSMRSEWQVGW